MVFYVFFLMCVKFHGLSPLGRRNIKHNLSGLLCTYRSVNRINMIQRTPLVGFKRRKSLSLAGFRQKPTAESISRGLSPVGVFFLLTGQVAVK